MSEEIKLYHYCKIKTFIECILPSKKLLLNPYRNTNDPHENKEFGLPSKFNNNPDPWTKLKDEIDTEREINDFISNNVKLVCFSISKLNSKQTTLGCMLPRMWAIYGENHQGICIELDYNKLKETNKILLNSDLTFKGPVKYKTKLDFPQINIDKAKNNINDYTTNYVKRHHKRLFFQKHVDWSGEKEYRILTMENIEGIDITNCTKKVILGLNTPRIYERIILHINALKEMELYQIEFDLSNSNYKLKPLNLIPY